MKAIRSLGCAAVFVTTFSALASRDAGMPRMQVPTATPQEEAQQLYDDGVSYRDKATKLEAEAAAETDLKKREKLEGKAKDKHLSSIKKFQKATEKNPAFFQAWGGLGYAYRKTGDHTAALAAYDKSLALQPNYTPAIEYRAEAYLGLGRLGEVKAAYLTLFNADRPRADELAAAIETWLAARKADAAGVPPEALEEFASWAAQRKQLASQTSSTSQPSPAKW